MENHHAIFQVPNKVVKHRSASLHWTEFKSRLCGFAAQKYSTKPRLKFCRLPRRYVENLMKIFIFIMSALLGGCVVTQWDGYAEEKHFEISISEHELPVKGVTSLCKPHGDVLYMEEAISQELNQSAQPSGESGKINMSYKEFRIGGSYNSFFGLEWGNSPFPKVECSLFHSGKKIHTFEAVSSKNSFEVKLQ